MLVPLSGGGLAAGIAAAVKARQPRSAGHRRLDGARRGDEGEPRRRPAGAVEELPTLADSLGGGIGLDNR